MAVDAALTLGPPGTSALHFLLLGFRVIRLGKSVLTEVGDVRTNATEFEICSFGDATLPIM